MALQVSYQGLAQGNSTPSIVTISSVAPGRYSIYSVATLYSRKTTIAAANFVLAFSVNGDNPNYDSIVNRYWSHSLSSLEGQAMLTLHGAIEVMLPNQTTNSLSAKCYLATGSESFSYYSALMFRALKTFYVKSV